MGRSFACLLAAALLVPLAPPAFAGDASTPAPAAGVCPVDTDQGLARAELMARLEAKLRAAMPAGSEDVVVLNGRGYRYDSAPSIARDLQQLEIELQRAKARQAK